MRITVQNRTARTSPRRRKLKIALGIIAGLVLAHSVAVLILGHMVESRIMAYKAQGLPVSAKELAGPPIPDSENGGVLFAQIFDKVTNVQKIICSRWKASEELTPNTRTRYNCSSFAGKLITANANDAEMNDPNVLSAARAYTVPVRELLPQIEEAAAKPKCRYKANWQDGRSTLLPYIPGASVTGRSLAIMAALNAHDGNMKEAVRALQAVSKIEQSLKEEPTLIGLLVRSRLIYYTFQGLQHAAQYGTIDKDQAFELYSALGRSDLKSHNKIALDGERVLGISSFDEIQRISMSLGSNSGSIMKDFFYGRILPSYFWRPFLYADELQYFHLTDSSALMSNWREIRASTLNKTQSSIIENLPTYAVLTTILWPEESVAVQKRDEGIAEAYGIQVFLALLAYKDTFGGYPASLDELRSKLGWKLQADPFSGKDFVYKRKGNGFLLYSIGPNLRDDGGIKDRPREVLLQKAGSEPRDDIAWQMEK